MRVFYTLTLACSGEVCMFITNTRSDYLAGDEPRRAMVGVAVSFTVDRCHVHQDQVTSVGVNARETHTHRRKHPSAAQSTAVHDGRLHPHVRHCSSPASAVRRLPSAVRTATPAFHVRSSGLFCSRNSLYQTTCEIRNVPLRQFSPGPENFFSRSTGLHSALEALRLCAI